MNVFYALPIHWILPSNLWCSGFCLQFCCVYSSVPSGLWINQVYPGGDTFWVRAKTGMGRFQEFEEKLTMGGRVNKNSSRLESTLPFSKSIPFLVQEAQWLLWIVHNKLPRSLSACHVCIFVHCWVGQ
jgi:hypothetical protein